MPRTTLDLDGDILQDLRRLQVREGKPLGRLVSELLADALGHHRAGEPVAGTFRWNSKPLGARVDLSDKQAILSKLDEIP